MTDRASDAPRQLRPTEVKRLNREWRRATQARLALLLDSVSQPFNVGSIIRSAAALAAATGLGSVVAWTSRWVPSAVLPTPG